MEGLREGEGVGEWRGGEGNDWIRERESGRRRARQGVGGEEREGQGVRDWGSEGRWRGGVGDECHRVDRQCLREVESR
jgi:hypothetical protein